MFWFWFFFFFWSEFQEMDLDHVLVFTGDLGGGNFGIFVAHEGWCDDQRFADTIPDLMAIVLGSGKEDACFGFLAFSIERGRRWASENLLHLQMSARRAPTITASRPFLFCFLDFTGWIYPFEFAECAGS